MMVEKMMVPKSIEGRGKWKSHTIVTLLHKTGHHSKIFSALWGYLLQEDEFSWKQLQCHPGNGRGPILY